MLCVLCGACRTDFDCCSSHDDYNPHHNKLDDTSAKVKAAGCEWNIDLLKEIEPVEGQLDDIALTLSKRVPT
jgi:hypothetical protein